MRLSCGNGAFPLLSVEQSIRLTRLLEFEGFDLVLMGNSAHTRPEDIADDISGWAAGVKGLVDAEGLEVADVFCVPWTDFTTMAPNHPNAAERARGRQLFREMLDLASALDASGITMLPGVDWPNESHEDSLVRAAAELQARADEAGERGLGFSIEPHLGSVCRDPADVLTLCELAPTLRLTLDYTHFVSQGVAEADIEPLAPFARYVQTRGVAFDRLQAPLKDTFLDFERMVDVLAAAGYDGYINVEYVWVDWKRLNEVDVLSETVMLRDRLNAKFRDEPWSYPGPTGITNG
ncbi:MAG: sugar phosphate isomerase/epimerase family protein [Ilumatobacteraceae bacterium]